MSKTAKSIESGTKSKEPEALMSQKRDGAALAAFVPDGDWFRNVEALTAVPPLEKGQRVDTNIILEKKRLGMELYESLVSKFEKDMSRSKDSDANWMRTVLHSGTTSDKLSAMTLLVQQAPFYRLKTLDSLIAMATKKGRRESAIAISSLKDLFGSNLLPERRLVPFHQRNLTHPSVTNNHLIWWAFEDQLKGRYAEFVHALEKGSRDTIVHFKNIVLKCIFELLCEKPEQEQLLLSVLINKLGDIDRSIASKGAYYLTLLLERHPAMRIIVVREIETFLHRPNISPRAQYYSIIFLNQIVLDSKSAELSEKLIGIYFSMFTQMLGTKQKDSKTHFGRKAVSSRLLSALLSGVNRAFPFSAKDSEIYAGHLDTLFKIVHIASATKAVQALMLIWQVMHAQGLSYFDRPVEHFTTDFPFDQLVMKTLLTDVNDRFYRALYEKILSDDLFHGSRQSLFLNLLFKSMKNDKKTSRVSAFVKRVLQVCHYQSPNIVCALLYVISEVLKAHPKLAVLVSKPEPITNEARKISLDVSNHFVDDTAGSAEAKPVVDPKAILSSYDGQKREPAFSNAETSCYWELTSLVRHYHPSVASWAQTILSGKRIYYGGDPIRDFDLMSFFDRFSYKKPKEGQEGHKIAQKLKTGSIMQSHYVPYVDRTEPVNSESFSKLPLNKVRPEEVFFHRFFNSSASQEKRDKKKKDKKRRRKGEEDEDVDEYDSSKHAEDGEEGPLGETEDIPESEINRILEAELDDDFFDDDDVAKELDLGTEFPADSKLEKGPKASKQKKPEDDEFQGLSDDDAADSLEGEGEHSYSDLEESDFDDDEDIGDINMIESVDEESADDTHPSSKKGGSDFADFDDFAHLLEDAGKDDVNPKRLAWEERGKSGQKGSWKKQAGSTKRGRPFKAVKPGPSKKPRRK